MPRKRVAILQPSGKKFWVKRHYAAHLVATGDHEVVTKNPLVIQPIFSRYYKEELRFLNGRIVTGTTHVTLDGNQQIGAGLRTRPPRLVRGRKIRLEDTGWADRNRCLFE